MVGALVAYAMWVVRADKLRRDAAVWAAATDDM